MKRLAPVVRLHSLYVLSAMIVNVFMLREGVSGADAMTLRTFSGQPLNAAFGQSVAGAGDVNSDGYNDLVIGALYNGEGRVYIFFGGATMDTIPDVTLNCRMSNDRFGECVAGAGDVNGDGYADVIVGARISGPLGLDSGHVYIFFGGAVMDSTPDVIMAGLPSELFGRSVAGAGDVNGDGYADVIVGAYGSDAGGLDAGRVYIFFGGVTVDNIPDVIFTGTYLENLGYSVAGAGDVNNDGFDDVVVGGPGYIVTSAVRGRAYVYFGGSAMDNVPDVVTAAGDRAGTTVAGAGDVNGDGHSDVLVSDTRNGGRVLVYYGGSAMNNVADVTLNHEEPSDNFGYSVASAGDVNGDSYTDIIIGAVGYNSSTGKAYIYHGGASMDTIPDLTFVGEAALDRFGESVAGAGDVNGDGFSDVIIGAKYGGTTDAGRAYLYFSTDGPLPIQLASFTATAVGSQEVRLDWATLSEVNNYGFEVQRKQTGNAEFQTLPHSFVPGHGTTIEPHSYLHIDSTTSSGQWSYRLEQMDLDGSIYYSEPVNITILTSVEESAVPTEFALEQNYPNPFNPSTKIRFHLPAILGPDGQAGISAYWLVTLQVYDVLGQEMATLVNERLQPGNYERTFDATGLASGVYYYRISVDGIVSQGRSFTQARRMLLIK